MLAKSAKWSNEMLNAQRKKEKVKSSPLVLRETK